MVVDPLMAPCLRALEDGQTRTIHEIRGRVAAEIGITDEDKQEMIKSGISVFDSRTAWAVTYMAQARPYPATAPGDPSDN